mmetsp:Transcript_24723/g.53935  ORF Transcript_24723/g.53935 Transcript_24723/m.53935 type:complete len:205 (+) Transcript_24723:371-985(+)
MSVISLSPASHTPPSVPCCGAPDAANSLDFCTACTKICCKYCISNSMRHRSWNSKGIPIGLDVVGENSDITAASSWKPNFRAVELPTVAIAWSTSPRKAPQAPAPFSTQPRFRMHARQAISCPSTNAGGSGVRVSTYRRQKDCIARRSSIEMSTQSRIIDSRSVTAAWKRASTLFDRSKMSSQACCGRTDWRNSSKVVSACARV